ncbi:unnamed protein product [Chrysodeixis includens]|uniref:Uncharacterized protein n=1 Tax=Chrysodeixis includens TaxID=689277 RepID=A0A9N8KRG3_CHRIL|nr:unnamed protein product [Chrysodeixis includens]
MRSVASRYPVDRYLVESSNNFEMVNIIDNDLWNTEPALKPEDELILRKLHEMLQSTADDLKLLSGELSKFHEPGVQVKTTPTPLDEEFNEKVHIEEIVNAKFHGYKVIDSPENVSKYKSNKDLTENNKTALNSQKSNITNVSVPVKPSPIYKKPIINRNLEVTRTKIIQINGNENSSKTEKLNNGKVVNAPAVAYNEYSYKYVEPKLKKPSKVLQVQEMPTINIRSELKEQKVLQLDILPEVKKLEKADAVMKNVAVVACSHEVPSSIIITPNKTTPMPTASQYQQPIITIRKVSKMSTYDSSGSTNNISSDTQTMMKTQKRILTSIRSSPKSSSRTERKKVNHKKDDKRPRSNLEEWRKKLNSVYGSTNTMKNKTLKSRSSKSKESLSKTNVPSNKPNNLNNIQYIPYSKLTVGGVRASDIEREISDIPNNRDIPLSPILDKILSSRENSFSKNSPRKHIPKENNILTTSDENLLQEVIDIERTVSETLSKNIKKTKSEQKHSEKVQQIPSDSDDGKGNESYDDDFEDEKSDHSEQDSEVQNTDSTHSSNHRRSSEADVTVDSKNEEYSRTKEKPRPSNEHIHNLTYTKSNLSFKNTVDVFEFVHSVDTQDSATQSNTGQRKAPKETQTSPTCDKNLQPIHNDLWPSLDPKGEVEKMYQIEKDFIKKLIVEEYSDILEKNIDKPSTSKEVEIRKNVAASQKNTQTSPAHVKHVMTSPTRTKTRTTSPFTTLTVDHHTSPLIFVTNEDDDKGEFENEDEPGISINLSSPRFSLRLPRTSREVLSNIGDSIPRTIVKSSRHVNKCNNITSSSSSMEAESSEISSLGEIKLKRRFGHTRILSDSESVSSSKYSSDFFSGILPLKSEGEMSLGLAKKSNKQNKSSEGEASFGLL